MALAHSEWSGYMWQEGLGIQEQDLQGRLT